MGRFVVKEAASRVLVRRECAAPPPARTGLPLMLLFHITAGTGCRRDRALGLPTDVAVRANEAFFFARSSASERERLARARRSPSGTCP